MMACGAGPRPSKVIAHEVNVVENVIGKVVQVKQGKNGLVDRKCHRQEISRTGHFLPAGFQKQGIVAAMFWGSGMFPVDVDSVKPVKIDQLMCASGKCLPAFFCCSQNWERCTPRTTTDRQKYFDLAMFFLEVTEGTQAPQTAVDWDLCICIVVEKLAISK